MEDTLYHLFLVIFGIILGMVAKDPLKNLVTGKYKEDARQKKRVKLLLYIRERDPKKAPTTEELAENVFEGKLAVDAVTELLKEIEALGLIKEVANRGQSKENSKWQFVKK